MVVRLLEPIGGGGSVGSNPVAGAKTEDDGNV